jgi:hypothetical protein
MTEYRESDWWQRKKLEYSVEEWEGRGQIRRSLILCSRRQLAPITNPVRNSSTKHLSAWYWWYSRVYDGFDYAPISVLFVKVVIQLVPKSFVEALSNWLYTVVLLTSAPIHGEDIGRTKTYGTPCGLINLPRYLQELLRKNQFDTK